MLETIRRLLAPHAPLAAGSLDQYWQALDSVSPPAESTFARAVRGGLLADRAGYAFAAGYQAALRVLVPGLDEHVIATLCVTEQGGGHPRAIASCLRARPGGGFLLSGEKRWATLALSAGVLLIVAAEGSDENGRKRLRVVQIDPRRPGVRLEPMPPTAFVPEISHAELHLDHVAVREEEVLPGDGYERVVKPFRTVEDIHVFAALTGYVLGEATRLGLDPGLRTELLASLASLSALSAGDPRSPVVHAALAGAMRSARRALDAAAEAWEPVDPAGHARWMRDMPLLRVAELAREKRTERALAALAAPEPNPGAGG